MIVKRIEGAQMDLSAPENWDEAAAGKCVGLPIRIESHGGVDFMVSAWEPSPTELEALNAGAPIHLFVSGPMHPVVALEVGPPAPTVLALQ